MGKSTLGIIGASLLLLHCALAQQEGRYQYVFPKPNSRFVSCGTNIILRPGEILDPSSLIPPLLVAVKGSQSGYHEGALTLSDDGRTILFSPQVPFVPNEQVIVKVLGGIRGIGGADVGGTSFEFSTSPHVATTGGGETGEHGSQTFWKSTFMATGTTAGTDSLPADFPPIRIDTLNDPAPGKVFLANFGPVSGAGAYGNYLIVLDNSGKPSDYKKVSPNATTFAYNFTTQPDGRVSYVERTLTSSTVFVMDTSLKVVDRFQGGNGYTGDIVDFRLLPNGHAMLLIYDWQTMDLSKIVPGGHPAANVCETVIQELDLAKNVVFQWRSIDHIPITDAFVDSLAASVDYMHSNGFEFDTDGGILLSSRHLSEITKLDGTTGEIIWRLGGKRNQFTFVGERESNKPNYFSFQHDVSRLSTGNILMFDNGNQHTPQYSRVVEYNLDERNHVATLVWEYRHSPEVFSSANGSAQRLSNGNTFIGWGNAGLNGLAAASEVRPDKSPVFEFSMPKGQRSWRAYRFPWKVSPIIASYSRFDLLQGNSYLFNGSSGNQRTGVRISFPILQPVFYNGATVSKLTTACLAPAFSGRPPHTAATRFTITKFGMTTVNADVSFDVALLDGIPDPRSVRVFSRDTVDSGVFRALPTWFNDATNEIVASTSAFGEFILCWNDSDSVAVAPSMLEPAERDSVNQLLPVSFRWNPRGHSTGYHFQVARDSLFKTLVLNDSSLTGTADTLKTVTPGSLYYWRVRARNYNQVSAWSQARMFTTTLPYVSVTSPSGKENWQRGLPYFVKWLTNVKDRVRIELFKSANRLLTIKDSVANVGAFSWTVPSNTLPDSTYKIKITSVSDSSVYGFSTYPFSISDRATAVEQIGSIPEKFVLFQNFPNPFNPSTAIRYQLAASSFVELKVYDALGRTVATLVNEEESAGLHRVTWNARNVPSGVYVYRIVAGSQVESKKMLLLK